MLFPRPTLPLALISALLTTGCANTAGSEIKPTCDALAPYLPTYSTRDTLETRESGLRFLNVYAAVCQ